MTINRTKRQPAFTLIELLVVISIIALLLTVLIPSLSSARTAAKRIVCLSNMKQLGVGWTIYSDLNKGAILPGRMAKISNSDNVYDVGNGKQFRPRWFVTMGQKAGFFAYQQPSADPADDNIKQVDGSNVFLCPQVAERRNNRNFTYGYNHQFLGNARFKGKSEAKGFINFPVPDQRVNGANTVLCADSLGTAAGKPRFERTPYRDDGSSDLFAIGNHAWSLDPPRLTDSSDYCDDNNRAPEHRSAPEMRHGGKTNVLWCDGHADAQTYKSLGYVENDDGSIAANGQAATNRFFSGTARDDDPPPIN